MVSEASHKSRAGPDQSASTGRITTSPISPTMGGAEWLSSGYSLDPLLFISEEALEDRVADVQIDR